MKIVIKIDENISETEIQVSCKQLTEEVENMIATLRIMNEQMFVHKDQETYLLDVSRISYIESVERKSFVYTEDDVLHSN